MDLGVDQQEACRAFVRYANAGCDAQVAPAHAARGVLHVFRTACISRVQRRARLRHGAGMTRGSWALAARRAPLRVHSAMAGAAGSDRLARAHRAALSRSGSSSHPAVITPGRAVVRRSVTPTRTPMSRLPRQVPGRHKQRAKGTRLLLRCLLWQCAGRCSSLQITLTALSVSVMLFPRRWRAGPGTALRS